MGGLFGERVQRVGEVFVLHFKQQVNVGMLARVFLRVQNVFVIGIKLGGVLDSVIGKRAELFGGIVLIGIGTFILLEHLGLMA